MFSESRGLCLRDSHNLLPNTTRQVIRFKGPTNLLETGVELNQPKTHLSIAIHMSDEGMARLTKDRVQFKSHGKHCVEAILAVEGGRQSGYIKARHW
jgi:hypothetical protein